MASPRPDPLRQVDRVLAPLTWLIAAFAVVVLFVGPELIGAEKAGAPEQTGGSAPADAAPAGADVFASAGCGGCHTLAAADATGSVGPNLDELEPDSATVATVVSNGSGSMPAFGDLSDAEVQAVADYVASSAGG